MATYRLLRKLAAGGMAEVFLGKVVGAGGFEKPVAVKRILPHLTADASFIDQFLAEARLTVSLQHANVVQIFDLGKTDSTWSMVLEFIDGDNLRAIMRAAALQQRRLQLHEAAWLALQAAEGLAYAHTRMDSKGKPLNIIHRDVTPSNVMVSKSGEVKIADFGIAKAASSTSHTQAGMVKGKAGYLSPEQVRGAELDQRSDVFNLGILLFELIRGQRLFRENDMYKSFAEVGAFRPQNLKLDDLPADLVAVMAKSLSPNPKERFDNARGFADALTAFLFQNRLRVTTGDIAKLFADLFPGRKSPLDLPPELNEEMVLVEGTASSRSSVVRALNRGSEADLSTTAQPAQPSLPQSKRKMKPYESQLLEMLLERGILKRDQLKAVIEKFDTHPWSMPDVLIQMGMIEEHALIPVLSSVLQIKYLSDKKLREIPAPASYETLLPQEKAEKMQAVPVSLPTPTQLYVAMKDPTDLATIDQIKFISGVGTVIPLLASESGIRRTIGRFYQGIPDREETSWDQQMSASGIFVQQPSVREADRVFQVEQLGPGGSSSSETTSHVTVTADGSLESRMNERLLETLISTFDKTGVATSATHLAIEIALKVDASSVTMVRSLSRLLSVASLVEGKGEFGPPGGAYVRRQLGPMWDEVTDVIESCLAGGFLAVRPKNITSECLVAALGLHWLAKTATPRGELASRAFTELSKRAQLSERVLHALAELTAKWQNSAVTGKAVGLAVPSGPEASAIQLKLAQEGWKVLPVRSVQDLEQTLSQLNVAVLDMELMGNDPIRLVKAAKSARPNTRIFMVVANGDDPLVSGVIDAGADDVLVRPVNAVLLASKLRKAVAGS